VTDLILGWYGWLGRLAEGPVILIDGWVESVNVPMVTRCSSG
jgi:hypothetical protein